MMFKGITHVIRNPQGHAPGYNYSLVGSVPRLLADCHKWETVAEIKDAISQIKGAQLCSLPSCACAALLAEKK
jgi:hypothetical protein